MNQKDKDYLDGNTNIYMDRSKYPFRVDSIFTIAWHKRNLRNSTDYERRKKDSILSDIKKLNELHLDNKFREFQLSHAKKEGKTKFTEKYKQKLFSLKKIQNEYKLIP